MLGKRWGAKETILLYVDERRRSLTTQDEVYRKQELAHWKIYSNKNNDNILTNANFNLLFKKINYFIIYFNNNKFKMSKGKLEYS